MLIQMCLYTRYAPFSIVPNRLIFQRFLIFIILNLKSSETDMLNTESSFLPSMELHGIRN